MVVALGQFAWQALAAFYELRPRPAFGHRAEAPLPGGLVLLGSYHPSQQNTFTGTLDRADVRRGVHPGTRGDGGEPAVPAGEVEVEVEAQAVTPRRCGGQPGERLPSRPHPEGRRERAHRAHRAHRRRSLRGGGDRQLGRDDRCDRRRIRRGRLGGRILGGGGRGRGAGHRANRRPGGAAALAEGIVYLGGGTPIQTVCGFEDSLDDMYRYMMAACGPDPDESKIARYCAESLGHFDWLEARGVPFDPTFCADTSMAPNGTEGLVYSGGEDAYPFNEIARPAPRGHLAKTKRSTGWLLMQHLAAAATEVGASVSADTRVDRLVVEDERVVGVQAQRFGETVSMRARRGGAGRRWLHLQRRHAAATLPASRAGPSRSARRATTDAASAWRRRSGPRSATCTRARSRSRSRRRAP